MHTIQLHSGESVEAAKVAEWVGRGFARDFHAEPAERKQIWAECYAEAQSIGDEQT